MSRVVFLAIALAATSSRASEFRFNRDIRPILSDACFQCHGPDSANRKAGLRLDLRDAALAEGAIVPGKPDASSILERVRSKDPDEVMPPPESNLHLSPADAAKLEAWIAAGAEYEPHWAFVSPAPVAPPSDPSPWIRNPIDAFVLTRLRAESLEPSPEAPRETLARRAAFDLTGLPPAPADLDAFLADPSPDAYERFVDRLLAAPAFGERLALDWLDAARYADTYGYQADRNMEVWPWRDWVIRAFADNLPYDRFILWQTAGDLLPAPTRDQFLATAFNRLHRQTNEGGSIDEEFRVEYVSDRVHTNGTAFLGLTLECARCHDHKYDPISQRDYYALSAFFNRIDESGLYSHFTETRPTPALKLFQGDQESRWHALRARLREAESAFATARDLALRNARPGEVALPVPLFHEPFAALPGGTLRCNGDDAHPAPQDAPFRRTDAFSFVLRLRPGPHGPRQVVLHRSRAAEDSAFRGYQLTLDQGRPEVSLIHFWPGNALRVRARDVLPAGAWSEVAVTYDGSSRAAGIRLHVNGRPVPVDTIRDHLTRDIVHRKEWGDFDVAGVKLDLGARFRDNGFKDGEIDDLRVYPMELTHAEVLLLADPRSAPDEPMLREHAALRGDPALAAARDALAQARREEDDLVAQVREIMVLKDAEGPPRPTYVLRRGAYDARGDEVGPGVPEAILPFPGTSPRNRLGLAHWLLHPDHPLTARVAVNRFWQQFFGRGLVTTPEDFGSQGQPPTHPDLLDWLAVEFRTQGWDVKRLCRLIATSATYRQSSVASPALVSRDPANLLLARGPAHRLSAEQIRDQALAVSGLLVPRIGGPSVKPWQPPGLWRDSGTPGGEYVPDSGEGRHRRSLYTFWKRTAPPPNMLAFDAPNREVCTVRREPTATPLQALVLLNDPQFLEAARALARNLAAAHPTDDTALARAAFRAATSRLPSDVEAGILRRLFDEQRAHFATRPEAAAQLLSEEGRPAPPDARLAAATALAGAVLNHDEFVMKR
jgi:hypothetical protein